MEGRASPAGNERYAGWREGTHDDLVFAVALAYWSCAEGIPRRAAWGRSMVDRRSHINEALSGKRPISAAQARKRGKRFNVDAGLFL